MCGKEGLPAGKGIIAAAPARKLRRLYRGAFDAVYEFFHVGVGYRHPIGEHAQNVVRRGTCIGCFEAKASSAESAQRTPPPEQMEIPPDVRCTSGAD